MSRPPRLGQEYSDLGYTTFPPKGPTFKPSICSCRNKVVQPPHPWSVARKMWKSQSRATRRGIRRTLCQRGIRRICQPLRRRIRPHRVRPAQQAATWHSCQVVSSELCVSRFLFLSSSPPLLLPSCSPSPLLSSSPPLLLSSSPLLLSPAPPPPPPLLLSGGIPVHK